MKRIISRKRGFSLIELMVVISLISILSLFSFWGYNFQQNSLLLKRSKTQLIGDMEKVKEMAIASKEIHGIRPKGGYGIFLQKGSSSYILFADCNGNHLFDHLNTCPGPSPEKLETISFKKKVYIQNLPADQVSLTFVPPAPDVYIMLGPLSVNDGFAVLGVKNFSKTVTIYFNKSGLIY